MKSEPLVKLKNSEVFSNKTIKKTSFSACMDCVGRIWSENCLSAER